MKRFLLAGVLAAVACSVAFAKSGTFSNLSASVASLNAPRPLYTTEQERLVSAIAGSILNIAAFADRFETGDAFQVRNVLPSGKPTKFTIARRAEVFTVEVPGQVWAPRSYVRLARSFMADGAGLTISEDPVVDRVDVALVLDGGPDGVRTQNARLSRLLGEHPRSAALHERAALVLAAAARRHPQADRRQLLCRMTAHLAVARALHQGTLSADGELAERLLTGFATRQDQSAAPSDGHRWPDGPAIFGEPSRIEILPVSGSEVPQL
jgi:hypothetical protein